MQILDNEIVDKPRNQYQIKEEDIKEYDLIVNGSTVDSKASKVRMGVLSAIDLRIKNYIDHIASSPEDSEKSFKAETFLLLKWFSAVGEPDWNKWNKNGKKGKPPYKDSDWTDYHIEYTNMMINLNYNNLYNHPQLMYKLFMTLGSGEKQNHYWLNLPAKFKNSDLLNSVLIKKYGNVSKRELDYIKDIITKEEILEIAEGLAMDDKEIEKLVNEIDAL